MNLVFQSNTRDVHEHVKDALENNKIKFKVIDDDMFKIGFKIAKDDLADFQMNLANNVLGANFSGSFYVEQ